MKIEFTPLDGLKVIRLDLLGDSRGFFLERFNADTFAAHGLPTAFRQDNHSRSAPGVLRGLHYQFDPPQGKLVGCARGRIWDVAVDIRESSPTFGQWFGLELSDENATLLWLPAGFAHGFCVLGDGVADVLYKCSETYHASGEEGLAWNDPELAIDWPLEQMKLISGAPVISKRDGEASSFTEYKRHPRF